MDNEKHSEEGKDFFALGVDGETFAEALAGPEMQICLSLDDENYTEIVENFQGALMLNCDPPDEYHGVYYLNHGCFPYIIKEDLKRVMLVHEGTVLPMTIVNIAETPGQRFRFDHVHKRTVSDPNGDSCIWEVTFTLRKDADEPQIVEPRTFLLRWNPSISSFKLDEYRELARRCPDGFRLNWSIHQWQEAHKGDRFYMMRVGDEHAGLIFHGWFTSEPYAGDDWSGRGKVRYYADMDCLECSAPDAPLVPLAELKEALPELEWDRGHSGVLLSPAQAAALDALWKANS